MRSLKLSQGAAASALLRRKMRRENLATWCIDELAPLKMRPARHHRMLIDRLEAVASGEIDRLMVLMPPGSAKSTYVSSLFPPWWLARDPSRTIITASHTQELADHFGRRVRNLVAARSNSLGFKLAADSTAAGRWATDRKGEFFAVGVGGAVAGRRADLVVIDDPVKSRADADSLTTRNRVWDWYNFDLLTRLKPGGAICLVMTRWHEDDLGGRLLAEMEAGGDQWEVLSLPMLAEPGDAMGRAPGEPLWPEWFTPRMLAQAQRDPRVWSALYQQRPAPEEGSFFKREWFRTTPSIPPLNTLRIYGASDYAVSEGRGDYTVHVVVGVDPEDRLYLLDLWRGQTDSSVWVEAFCDLVLQWRPIGWAEESGQILSGVGPWLEKRMRERRAAVARQQFASRHDKAIRAQSIRGRMALDGLYIPHDAPWRADFEAEALSFPAGKNDDQVDALGLVGQLLQQMQSKSRGAFGPEKPRDRYGRSRPGSGSAWAV